MILLLMSPEYIVNFCSKNPLNFADRYWYQTGTRRGAKGNVMPPTPASHEFFRCLKSRHGELMTQREYWEWCVSQELWHDWYYSMDEYTRKCFSARLYRNFYPSFIDSLYVWALLGTRYQWEGKHVFDRCEIDTYQDVIKKVDLILCRGQETLRVALTTNSRNSTHANTIKHSRRGQPVDETIHLILDVRGRAKGPGNKRWFHWPVDFEPVFKKSEQLWLFKA